MTHRYAGCQGIPPLGDPALELRLPDWLKACWPEPTRVFATEQARMAWVIELSRCNIREGTGGPFAAAVFDRERGTLLAQGVNLVVSSHWSGAHGEMVALALAQRLLQTHDLAAADLPPLELVSSTEPCTMCLGATVWSGVRQLVCGARGEDAEAVGFDEGPKPEGWVEALQQRGIDVVQDLLRPQAREVLREYVSTGGPLYNSRRPLPRQD